MIRSWCLARSLISSRRAQTGRAGSRHSTQNSETRTRISYCCAISIISSSTPKARSTYTVCERLTAMREEHEKRVERTLEAGAMLPGAAADGAGHRVQHATAGPPDAALPLRRTVHGRQESEVQPRGAPETIMTPFIVRGGVLWAFQDLRDDSGPFAHAITNVEARQYETDDWYGEAEHLGWYVALLNRCLNKLTGRLRLQLRPRPP